LLSFLEVVVADADLRANDLSHRADGLSLCRQSGAAARYERREEQREQDDAAEAR
jgi:hypothetical protein